MKGSEDTEMDAGDHNIAASPLLDSMPARRSVFEIPEILDMVFDYCNEETLRQISLVNRFFDAALAPKRYRKIHLSASGWHLDDGTDVIHEIYEIAGLLLGTPTPRQAEFFSHTRVLCIAPEIWPVVTNYDLSECSFAGVQIVEIDDGLVKRDSDNLRYMDRYPEDDEFEIHKEVLRETHEEDKKLAKAIAKIMAKIPDLRPSTIFDNFGLTLAVPSPTKAPPSQRPKRRPKIILPLVTRLVSNEETLSYAIKSEMEVPAAKRRTELRAVYPNLVEVVITFFAEDLRLELVDMLLALVEEGYKVVLAGFQAQNHDRDHVRKNLPKRIGAPDHIPNLDRLVDNLVDTVEKISLKEFFASSYGQYHHSAIDAELAIKNEEHYYQLRSMAVMRRRNAKDDGLP